MGIDQRGSGSVENTMNGMGRICVQQGGSSENAIKKKPLHRTRKSFKISGT